MESVHEEWRPVLGHESTFMVSSLGNVRSLPHKIRHRCGRDIDMPGRLVKQSQLSNGYLVVALRDGKKHCVHKLVLEAFVGPRPEKHEACHGNGIKTDNRLANLRWDTMQGNHRDRVLHGVSNRGERCGSAKLTASQVLEIYNSKERGRDLARHYGVAEQTICSIRKGHNWKHLTGAA